jgi:hypothetical protein
MTSNEQPVGGTDNAAGLPIDIDPGTTDLGDDVYRGATPSEGLGGGTGSELEGGLGAGLTDLGDDVYRDTSNEGSSLGDTGTGLEAGIDPGLTDLGDDVYRDAGNG